MSPLEVQDFCKTILPYNLRVKLKMKNDPDVRIGKIKSLDKDTFRLAVDNSDEQSVRYSFVAQITHA